MNKFKQITIAALSLVFAVSIFTSCGGGAKGAPEDVKAWKEIAEQAKSCEDTECLYGIQVNGKSITKWVMETNVEDMTEEELAEYNKYRDEYREIENKITGK